MDLIKIDPDGTITSRELYEFLQLAPSQFARWAKTNIDQDEFYTEGVDWWGFDIMSSGNEIKDYRLTIDFAKHLCMLSRSERGKQARSYFIEVEKRSKAIALQSPKTYAEALRELAATWEREQVMVAQLEAAKPKVEFFDQVAGSKDAISIRDVAKTLNIPNMGQNKLFATLREKKVLMTDNTPYQEYIDRGYFRVIEQKYNHQGEVRISLKTLVYQKGLDYIRRLVNQQSA